MNYLDLITKYKVRFPGPRTIECDMGWNKLIEEFLIELDKMDPECNITIFSIKEKFGLMRIYNIGGIAYETEYENWSRLVAKYEKLSSITCESCARAGIHQTIKGWMKVMCEECSK